MVAGRGGGRGKDDRKQNAVAPLFYSLQKREFYTNLTQISQLSGVAIPARQVRLHRMDTVPAYLDWRACTATPLSEVR